MALVYTSNTDVCLSDCLAGAGTNVGIAGVDYPPDMTGPRLVNAKHSDYGGGRKLGKEFCRITETITQRQVIACMVQGRDDGTGEAYASARICDGFWSAVRRRDACRDSGEA